MARELTTPSGRPQRHGGQEMCVHAGITPPLKAALINYISIRSNKNNKRILACKVTTDAGLRPAVVTGRSGAFGALRVQGNYSGLG